MTNNIALQLTCQRRALGLNISELADMLDIDKRVISFVERGERKPTDDHKLSMFSLSSHYELLTDIIKQEAQAFKIQNPATRLPLPYFSDFERFKSVTGNQHKNYWRLWQAAISHLVLVGVINHINDDADVPASFKQTWFWLNMGYDVVDLAEDAQ